MRWKFPLEVLLVGFLLAAFPCAAEDETAFARPRQQMVERQLKGRDITDARVLRAMGKVPLHRLVNPELASQAYADYPLPIGEGQTISQPYIVALMTQLLELQE